MKISKLFHWLYAFVMFLPIIAIGGAILVSTFNMQAKETQAVSTQYETNEVNSLSDIQSGNIYKFTYIGCNEVDRQYLNAKYIKISYTNNNLPTTIEYKENTLNYLLRSKFNASMPDLYFVVFNNNNNSQNYYSSNTSYVLYIVVDSVIDSNLLTYWNVTVSDFLGNTSVESEDIEDVFYRASDKVIESPYFSWAYNSFLAQPLVYIVTLFSIPANHIVVELLSYWLAISIIWLVFDLIMYVPLLVHRWLDKGVLE